jgi:hypothetical protein
MLHERRKQNEVGLHPSVLEHLTGSAMEAARETTKVTADDRDLLAATAQLLL